MVTSSFAYAEAPSIEYLFPAGGQRGQTVSVTLGGKAGDKPLQIWSSAADVTAAAAEEASKVNVTVAADAPAGPRWLRFYNSDGTSVLKTFIVGGLPELVETEPNDQLTQVQTLDSSRVVVNGRLEKGGDVDCFAVPLKAGESLVASVLANRLLNSPMDGVVQILAPNGFVLEQNHDDHGLDPQLVYSATADGVYVVRVFAFASEPNQAIRFSGSASYVYRLTMTTGSFADHALPLAATAGTAPTVEIVGWNIADKLARPPLLPAETGDTLRVPSQDHANWVNLSAVQHGSIIETEPNPTGSAQSVIPPLTITGRIGEPNDVDEFRFASVAGRALNVRIEARTLEYPLDPVLTLFGPDGKQIAEIDDAGNADAVLDHTTATAGEYTVRIRDLFGDGGVRYAYRLTIADVRPDYALSVAADNFLVKPNEPLEIPITVARSGGHVNEITINAVDLPEGVTAAEVKSPGEGDASKAVKLVLSSTRTEGWGGAFRIVGRTSAQKERVATASIAGTTETTRALWLTVTAPQPQEPAPATTE